MYGTLSAQCMEAVFRDWPDFGPNNIMLDIGSGISRPQVHALARFGGCSSIGVEFDEPKCLKASPFIQKACAAMGEHGVHVDASGINVLHGSSSTLTTLEPCTLSPQHDVKLLERAGEPWSGMFRLGGGRGLRLIPTTAGLRCRLGEKRRRGDGSGRCSGAKQPYEGWRSYVRQRTGWP